MTWPRSLQSVRDFCRHPEFRLGFKDTLSVNIGVGAWALVTGVAMVKVGLSVPLALFMSLVVYAGTAQLTALPLIAASAPTWLILVAAACVNLRFVVFSAAWRPFMMRFPRVQRLTMGYFAGDAVFIYFNNRYRGDEPVDGQLEYFWGAASAGWISWQVPTIVGVLLADVIPPEWGLAFAGVLALLGLTYSLINDGTSAIATAVAGVVAIAAFSLPFKLHLLVAIAAGVAIGLMLERGGPLRARPAR